MLCDAVQCEVYCVKSLRSSMLCWVSVSRASHGCYNTKYNAEKVLWIQQRFSGSKPNTLIL